VTKTKNPAAVNQFFKSIHNELIFGFYFSAVLYRRFFQIFVHISDIYLAKKRSDCFKDHSKMEILN
jgi:hypothetical protein